MFKFNILTIFPGLFDSFLKTSLIGKAVNKKAIAVNIVNIRSFCPGRHKQADDRPYGGSAGMVLMAPPVIKAIKSLKTSGKKNKKTILLSASGIPLTQDVVKGFALLDEITLVCGRYEGVDERIKNIVDEEYSVGDYVVMGGEVPAMLIIEAVSRLVRGVIKETASYREDSYYEGLLDCPVYTRPASFMRRKVPGVLLSGDHKKIEAWRRKEAIRRTYNQRPEMLFNKKLSEDEKQCLKELLWEKK